jgi:hypothetical protein
MITTTPAPSAAAANNDAERPVPVIQTPESGAIRYRQTSDGIGAATGDLGPQGSHRTTVAVKESTRLKADLITAPLVSPGLAAHPPSIRRW